MAQIQQRTLPGISPGDKTRLTLTDTLLDGTVNTVLSSPTFLMHGMLTMNPTAERTLTLMSAAELVTAQTQLTGLAVGDCIPFIVRNQSPPFSEFHIVLAMGANGTVDSEANLLTEPGINNSYILRVDSVNPTSPAYTVYQTNSITALGGTAVSSYMSVASSGATGTTTVTTAGTPVPLVGVTYTVGANVANPHRITLTGPTASGTTTFTVEDAGIYLFIMSFSGNVGVNNNSIIFTHVAVNGTVVVQEVGSVGNHNAMGDNHGDGCGSIIIPMQANGVLSIFLDTNTSGTTFDPEVSSISMLRIA